MKTVLVPNAPWPKWELVPPKRSHKKQRAKPSEVDANFDKWLQKEFPNVKRWR
jgi:hypothetical protein